MLKKLLSIVAAAIMGACLFCGCGETTPTGEFYSLQEAYDSGWLTQEDLLSIAYYHNGGKEGNEEFMAEDYEPIPKIPLCDDTESAIKEKEVIRLKNRTDDPIVECQMNEINISYYGTYQNKSVVIKLRNSYENYPMVDLAIWEEIGDISFHYSDPRKIEIWRQN